MSLGAHFRSILLPDVLNAIRQLVSSQKSNGTYGAIKLAIGLMEIDNVPLPCEIIEEASKHGHIDLIQILLDNGCISGGNKSIEFARENGHYYIEQILISRLTPKE